MGVICAIAAVGFTIASIVILEGYQDVWNDKLRFIYRLFLWLGLICNILCWIDLFIHHAFSFMDML